MRSLGHYVQVASTLVVEAALWCVGVLDLRPLFAPRGHECRVAIQAYAVHLAQFAAPIVAALRTEGGLGRPIDVECIVLPHPHFARSEQRSVEGWAAAMNMTARPYWRSLWQRYDLVICLDVFAVFPFRYRRAMLLMHGPGLTRRTVEHSLFRKTMADFDVVFVSGPFDRSLSEGDPRIAASGTRIVEAGTPFFDLAHLEAARNNDYRARLGLPRDTRLVLVAPSWFGLRAFHDRGLDWLSDVLAELSVTASCSVVLKLHAASLAGFIGGRADWRERLECLATPSGVSVDHDVDDRPALTHADLLVTDISSRAFAMMLLDKPVLLHWPVPLSRDSWDDRRSELLQRGGLVTTTRSELRAALDQPWVWGDRSTVANACFANPTSATSVVVAHIRKEATAGRGSVSEAPS